MKILGVTMCLGKHESIIKRLVMLALFCILSAVIAYNEMGFADYVKTWFGALAKATSGAALGIFICRFGMKINISEKPVEQQAVAGLGVCLVVAALAHAIATGS